MDPAVPGLCLIGFVRLGWLVQFVYTWFEPLDPFDFLIPIQQGGFQVVQATWGEILWEHVGNPCLLLYRKIVGVAANHLPSLWNSLNYFYMTELSEWMRGINEKSVSYYVSRVMYYLSGEGL